VRVPNANGARFLKDYKDINFTVEVAYGTIQNTFLSAKKWMFCYGEP
jgi:hypothetical protein